MSKDYGKMTAEELDNAQAGVDAEMQTVRERRNELRAERGALRERKVELRKEQLAIREAKYTLQNPDATKE